MTFERYLSPSENVVFVTRRHLWVLAEDLLVICFAILGLVIFPNPVVGIIALVIGVRFIWRGVDWFFDRLIITNQRIVGISGLLTRRVASMPLTMMTDLTYQRSLMGRILGFGAFKVESAGQDQSLSHIQYLANDAEFYQTLATMLHAPKKTDVKTPDKYAEEAMALVARGRPTTTWDPDDTNPNMIVLP